MILDWKKPNSIAMRKYIQTRIVDNAEEIHYCNPKRIPVEFLTFRNFPQLHINSNQMLDCNFENCEIIYFSNDHYGHCGCRFRNVKKLFCSSKFLKRCEFSDVECENTALIELNNCYCSSCKFENIRLLGETYLINGNGHSWGYGIRLNNITYERQDRQLFANVDVR